MEGNIVEDVDTEDMEDIQVEEVDQLLEKCYISLLGAILVEVESTIYIKYIIVEQRHFTIGQH